MSSLVRAVKAFRFSNIGTKALTIFRTITCAICCKSSLPPPTSSLCLNTNTATDPT